MTKCKYKPDKVCAAHILDEPSMDYEENIRNDILNKWTNVILKLGNAYNLISNLLYYYLRIT